MTPPPPPYIPQIRRYQHWLLRERGLQFDSYADLWRWSVNDLDAFWQSIWDYFDMQSPTPHTAVLVEPLEVDGNGQFSDGPPLGKLAPPGSSEPHEVGERGGTTSMIKARWFPGAQVNYVQQIFKHAEAAHAGGFMAIVSHNEKSLGTTPAREISWPLLRQQVASLALHLRAQGVQPGDRVAAYMPNIPEAIIAFLATASIGGVWSLCAPDMGTHAVLDRFRQIEPKVLFAVDGVTYGGRDMDRRDVVAQLCAALPTVTHLVMHDNLGLKLDATDLVAAQATYATASGKNNQLTQAFEPVWLPFDHPLWIVYSSGTTGLPKPIVHGHGGIMLVARALITGQDDVGCSYEANSLGERFHWYSSTGWVMWNCQVNGLLGGTTCCIFDGNPAGRTVDEAGNKLAPDWSTLWRFAEELGVTFFGAGAAFFTNCMKAGLDLLQYPGLTSVRALGTTGSPLSEDAQNWGTTQFERLRARQFSAGPPQGKLAPLGGREPHEVGERGGSIWWCNMSGGTDFAGAFIGSHRELPQIPGEMQCRLLGCAVEAWSEQGESVIGEVGELVCTRPIPSMPLYFWGDDGNKRYLSSYFDMYPGRDGKPAPWRHGDWLKVNDHGGCIIYGRSDATINRHGLRMGTSELYRAVEALPEVLDSMVVDLEYLGRESYMPLFVVLRDSMVLDDAMRGKLNAAIRTGLSPRFLPNDIFQVAEIPRTLSGKKQELPIKKLMLGQPIEKVINKEAMANPGCLDWYVALAQRHLAKSD